VAAATIVLGVTLRNGVVSRQAVLISTNGGINLHIGNNARMDETIAARPGEDWHRLVSLPFREGGARNEAEAQRWFLRRVRTYAQEHPGAFALGLARKARQFLCAREIPRNLDVYVLRQHSLLLGALVWKAGPVGFPRGIFLPLALAGLAVCARRSPEWRFLTSAAVLYSLSVIAFFPTSRYLAPLVPLLSLFAVAGARALAGSAATRWTALAVLAVAGVLVNTPVRLPTDRVNFEAELETNLGVALQTRGLPAEALTRYESAVRMDAKSAETWFYMGTAWRDLKRADRALECQRRALSLRPDHRRAMNETAVLLFNRGETAAAVAWLRKSLELDPLDRTTMANLAVGLVAAGNLDEANAWFRRAGRPEVRVKTGDTAAPQQSPAP
jgi:tetratricopeptide (TPR) repeat protein